MYSTLGVILTVALVLLSSLATYVTLKLSNAARAKPRFRPVSPATNSEPAPQQWESRLAELQADVVSLSSSFEKVTKAVTRQNQRDVMRERRSAPAVSEAPPIGADKATLYRHYGVAGKTPRQIAQHQLDLEASDHGRPN